ncbi:MAG: Rieske (2Fe-2S) protein [Aliishimia sp.]
MNWIAVGLSADIPRGLVMPSRVNGTELAIWRNTSGLMHAWADRCPHRGMRLSHGFVRNDTLSCIYHGWQYDNDGACRKIPAHPNLAPPKTLCATTYPCREQDGVIWVSLTDTTDMPPHADQYRSVRSLQITRSAQDVAAHFGVSWSPLITADELILALQPETENTCMVHVLISPERSRQAASRALETLRLHLEGVAA